MEPVELLVAALVMKTSMRCNFVMEWETLQAACSNNIQQFLQQQRGFNVAVWETCMNPSLLWVSPAWKIEQGSAIKQPAQHGAGKLPTKWVHMLSHAACSIHKQLHKNKTRKNKQTKNLTSRRGEAIRWILDLLYTLTEQTGDNGNRRFQLKSICAILSCSFIFGSCYSSQNPVIVIIRYHLVDTACNLRHKMSTNYKMLLNIKPSKNMSSAKTLIRLHIISFPFSPLTNS